MVAASPRLLYSLPHVNPTIYGSYYVMSSMNVAVVHRSWGLFQTRGPAYTHYGRSFDYAEFMVLPNRVYALLTSLLLLVAAASLSLFSFVRVNAFRKTVHLLMDSVPGTIVCPIEVAVRLWSFS